MANKYHRLSGGKMVPLVKTTASGGKPEMGEPYRMRPAQQGESSYSGGYKSTPSAKAKPKKRKIAATLRSK
jgi:hypothetical protein